MRYVAKGFGIGKEFEGGQSQREGKLMGTTIRDASVDTTIARRVFTECVILTQITVVLCLKGFFDPCDSPMNSCDSSMPSDLCDLATHISYVDVLLHP